MKLERFPDNPIITPNMDSCMGSNVNGPSLIRVPDWLENPLGRYYLYFGHHQGKYIRMAFADKLEGPWKTWEPGVLNLEDAFCENHIASPDVHVDDDKREFRMYYHGPARGGQKSRVALSNDGLNFTARPEVLGDSYFRVFQWEGCWYAISMPGIVYRSKDGLSDFEEGPNIFEGVVGSGRRMRHSALKLDGDRLSVFYSMIGDTPEHIVVSTIDLKPDWRRWDPTRAVTVVKPEFDYEGADLPVVKSVIGWAPERLHQLRDPAIYREDGRTFLLYSVAGEAGIAIGELVENGC